MAEGPKIRVKDLMSAGLITLEERDSIEKLIEVVRTHAYNSYPVLKGRKLVGIVEKRDLLKVLKRGVAPREFFHAPVETKNLKGLFPKRVEGVMRKDFTTVGPEEDLEGAIDLMLREKVQSLPVVRDGELVGIITCRDILNNLVL